MAALVAACVACSGAGTPARARPYAVGRASATFTDASRPGVAGRPGRTIEVQIWYPRSRGRSPLVVFGHGFGTSPDLATYRDLLSAWAAEGFVVAAPLFPLTRADAPGGPDAADYVNQPADMSFVISQLLRQAPWAGMIDPKEIGAAGHSLGGVTTLGLVANTCCRDPRVRAAVVMSGDAIGFSAGTDVEQAAPPLLFVHGDHDPAVPYAASVTAFNRAPAPKALLTIRGGDHGSPVDPAGPAFSTVIRVTTDFFDAYLRRDGGAAGRLPTDGTSSVTLFTFAARGGPPVTLAVPTSVGRARHATVMPTGGLVDGQVVQVTWNGFTPGVSVNVLECGRNPPTGAGDCALQSGKLLQPDPGGSGSVALAVHASVPAGSACGRRCVVVINEGGSSDASASVIVPISFA